MKTWRMRVLGVLCVVVVGCQDPDLMIPAQPPGTKYVPPLPPSEGEGAQALGEQMSHGQGPEDLKKEAEKLPLASPTARGETKTTKSGVKYETLKEGTGPEVKGGQTLMVHYSGTLENGTVFDSLRESAPYRFIAGVSPVIQGWTDGIPGMKVGERRKLIIPAGLAYKDKGQGKIPPNATLIFDVELLSAK